MNHLRCGRCDAIGFIQVYSHLEYPCKACNGRGYVRDYITPISAFGVNQPLQIKRKFFYT